MPICPVVKANLKKIVSPEIVNQTTKYMLGVILTYYSGQLLSLANTNHLPFIFNQSLW